MTDWSANEVAPTVSAREEASGRATPRLTSRAASGEPHARAPKRNRDIHETGATCPGYQISEGPRDRRSQAACGNLMHWDALYCDDCGAALEDDTWRLLLSREAEAREAAKRVAA